MQILYMTSCFARFLVLLQSLLLYKMKQSNQKGRRLKPANLLEALIATALLLFAITVACLVPALITVSVGLVHWAVLLANRGKLLGMLLVIVLLLLWLLWILLTSRCITGRLWQLLVKLFHLGLSHGILKHLLLVFIQ